MEPNETELPPDLHAPADDAEISFQVFDFDAVDSRIHPEAAPHSEHHYRSAGRAFLGFFDQCVAFMLTYDNPRLAAYVVALASGRSLLTGGISQKELADRLGITKAAVSKAVKNFQSSVGNDIAGIEPMPGQRKLEGCRRMAETRNHQVKNQNDSIT